MGIVAGILFDRLAWLATKPIAQPLTSPPETIPSCYRRTRRSDFQPHLRRYQLDGDREEGHA
jgi:hypothetical protein